jgi:adenylate cyclase
MGAIIDWIKPHKVAFIISFLFSGLFLLLSATEFPLLHDLEMKTLDLRFQIRGERRPNKDVITIVKLDDNTFATLDKTWPFPRSYHAKAVKHLKELGARLVAFDIIFSEPCIAGEDEVFAKEIRKAGNVILAANIEETTGWTGGISLDSEMRNLPIDILRDSASAVGFADIVVDPDGMRRRIGFEWSRPDEVLINEDGEEEVLPGERYYHLAYQVAKAYLGKDPNVPKGRPAYINFLGGSGVFDTISYDQVVDEEYYKGLKEKVEDKIILIGAFSELFHDLHPTVFSETTPGVVVNANAVENILYSGFIRPVRPAFDYIILIGLSFMAVFFLIRFQAVKATILIILSILGLFYFSIFVFARLNLFVKVVCPVGSVTFIYLGVILNRFIVEQREKLRIRGTFERYVTRDVMNELLSSHEDLLLEGKRREVTILFSDIRGFTSLSEEMDPKDVLSLLNEYFSEMVEVIFRHHGTVDKFIGDAIMAIFGAPTSSPQDPLNAVLAAIEMRDRLLLLEERWAREGKVTSFRIGVGINTGEVIVGAVGSKKRMEYTAIGDNVNVASRIESLTKKFDTEILITQSTYDKVKDHVSALFVKEVSVKGREKPIKVYKV